MSLKAKLVIISILLGAVSTAEWAHSQTERSAIRSKSVKSKRPKMRHFRIGPWFSQENIELKTKNDKAPMESQSMGMLGSLSFSYPFQTSRWSRVYEIDFAIGSIKGKGSTEDIADELEGQLWALGGGSAGLLYRSSPHSSLGFTIPVAARFINWSLAPDSQLEPEKAFSWSIGISGYYQNHFNIRSSLHVGITHHEIWRATVWNVAYQYRFR